jgi:hypothetical protein
MPLFLDSDTRLACPDCDGDGTVAALTCPIGCPASQQAYGEGCFHARVERFPCGNPDCQEGVLLCPEDGAPAVGHGTDGRPACIDCLREAGAAADSGLSQPPREAEGIRRAS